MATSVDTRTYMEVADDDGNIIDDSKTYVSTAPPGTKESANVSRTRNRTLTRGSSSSSSPNPTHLHTDSDSTTHPSSPLRQDSRKPRTKPRDKDKPSAKKTVTHATPAPRPSARSARTLPNLHTSTARKSQDQSTYYGISPDPTSPILTPGVTSSRPRVYSTSQRPNSYYGQPSKPPQSNARYWQHPNPVLGGSFPPPAPFPPPPGAPQFQPPFPPPPQQFVPPPIDYITSQGALAARFEHHRPRSAMGRQHLIDYSPEYEDPEEGGVVIRRPSLSRRRSTRQDADRIRMPPPPRPSTSRPQASSFAPPPPKRRSIGSVGSLFVDDDSLDGDDSLYSGVSPAESYPRAARRPSIDSNPMYDMGHGYAEVAGRPDRLGRRNSHYGARRQSTEREVEDKYNSALQYQDEVDGPTNPLTAATLRRITKTPSKSTKSSGSKGGSGYGRPAASRNSMDADDMTIFVKGMGSLTIGGAQLNIEDGAEIAIRTNGSERNSRGGSDNASTAYPDDSRTARFERPQPRIRTRSRAGSHSRTLAHHVAPAAPPHPHVDYYGNTYIPMAHAPYSPHPYPYNV
ncbi:hypothetical protein KVR01_010488 [Diaporthe batatas]|uniref:uncharacterized protein n=1 Tax=Diaporthe batatas TaxID=748121 RepID=UPI001D04D4ED|nr:uncharacterized protein KVR01_010488 [Diaporthe batatas]KAG8159851.1 hypothetical protein KVR01_010488 [Diaporthe batatas]